MVKKGFRFSGKDDPLTCLTCAHWRMQASQIKGLGKCALVMDIPDRHSYSGPYATCADYQPANPTAISKRKEILG